MMCRWAILVDLDQTLVLTSQLELLRKQREWTKIYQSFDKTTLPPETTEFIAKAKQIGVMAVVTTSPRPYAERLLRYHRIALPVVVAYHDVSKHKPYADPIIKAAEKLGVPTKRCIYIGDTVEDLQSADSAGATAVIVCWGKTLHQGQSSTEKALGIFSNWGDVYKILTAIISTRG
jgi:HAD superfamily hydrolase (TIGR01549 family)